MPAAIRQQDFSSPSQVEVKPATKRAALQGVTLTRREKGSRPAPDGVLTRVNVAGRHLGNRSCWYETCGRCPRHGAHPSAFAHQGDLADRRTRESPTKRPPNPAPLPIKGPERLSMLGHCSPVRGGRTAYKRPPPAPLPIKGPGRLSVLGQSLAVGFTWFRPEGAARYQGWPKVTYKAELRRRLTP